MSLHPDITKVVHESEYREHQIKIVERKMRNEKPFLWCYILKSEQDTWLGQYVRDKELEDLKTAIPKIKILIDEDILMRENYAKEIELKKKTINWTGRKFKRGDYVHFKGNEKYQPCDTYVWTHFGHLSIEFYLIEHKQGQDRSNWMTKFPFQHQDGFESVHSSQLKEGLKYLQIDCNDKFQGETDELILIKEKGK